MKTRIKLLFIAALGLIVFASVSCNEAASITATQSDSLIEVTPALVTDTVPNDSDDPAIWINKADPEKSLVLGTDKDEAGGLYVFNLEGKMDTARSVRGLGRPNNVDIEYGLLLNGVPVDIAVVSERYTHKIRVFSLPDLKPLDNGGLAVFEGEQQPEHRDVMGVSLFKNVDGKVYAIAGRKTGPTDETYLWQYLLEDDGTGSVTATLVRKFGKYSGTKEIEAIVVDDELGFVFYSDEGVGIRKYYSDPAKGNKELALFAETGFTSDHEGLSIYKTTDSTGFLIASDQQANQFQVFRREGSAGDPHKHEVIRKVKVAARESDGNDIVSVPLGSKFPDGLFVAMSDNKTFHYYQPRQILGDSLLKR